MTKLMEKIRGTASLRSLAAAALALTFLAPGFAHAASDAVAAFSGATAGPAASQKKPQAKRAELVKALALAIDAEAMGRAAAGSYWDTMTPQQRERFVGLFRRHLAGLIGDLLPDRLPETLDVGAMTPLPGGDRLVRTRIAFANGAVTPVAIRLRGDKDHPRIVDIILDSTSLAELKRSEISELAGREGMDAVMAELERRSAGAPVLPPMPKPQAAAGPEPAATAGETGPRRVAILAGRPESVIR